MTQILAVRGALPDHKYSQADLTAMFAETVLPDEVSHAVLERIHANAGVSFRHLAMPLEDYAELNDFGTANDIFIDIAVDLGTRAVDEALRVACLGPTDVDLIVSTTITGLAVPSLDARVSQRLGFRSDVKRVPIVGLGCVAGAAGVARLHDYLVGHPDDVAVLLSVELCSLTIQHADTSMANLVASSLFGDGAAALVAVGDDRASASETNDHERRPSVLASRSRMYPETERAMGWDVGSTGLRVVLGVEVPDLVRANIGTDVDEFLDSVDLDRADIGWWVCHPGGPKVLEAMEEALELKSDELAMTWGSLDRIGNLSSASVLHVLEDTLRWRPPNRGSFGLLMAMGPGFCLELVLMQA